jgi:hypothetical protein
MAARVIQSWNGEVSLASRLAEDALLGTSGDPYVSYWAALAGTTARQMLRNDDAPKALQEALELASAHKAPIDVPRPFISCRCGTPDAAMGEGIRREPGDIPSGQPAAHS